MVNKAKLVIVIGACFTFLTYGVKNIYSTENKGEGKNNVKIIIAHTEIFGKLERPHVLFNHSLHTKALKEESCGACHSTDENNYFDFEYPPREFKESKKLLMDFYHDTCIGCHKKGMEEGKKSGFITCGDCHSKKTALQKVEYPAFEFDFYYHNKHVDITEGNCSICHHIFFNKATNKLIYEKGKECSCNYCHQGKENDSQFSSLKKVSHLKCINCHINSGKEEIKGGPFQCLECHNEKNIRTVGELKNVLRPDRGQPEKTLIKIENARMKEVPFNHEYHENNTKTCKTCHHETLSACRKCHTLEGNSEGGMVNTANAYHDIYSEKSCIGCHDLKKKDTLCAGCHQIHKIGQGYEKTCIICHSGKKEKNIHKISKIDIPFESIPEDVEIKILENEYEKVSFPHLNIIKKLTDISNESKLASYFHKDLQTICQGCHHHSPVEIEKGVPACNTCHSSYLGPKRVEMPGLLGAYHSQCLGCHKVMKVEPTDCTGCHSKKE
ncbi:MAG: cytochrome c3 family protein [Thermodesulfobacteriota bacterium]|nr:cytochrome c3 family protein [Thermodesulfobacteriota bacterium]